MSGGASAGELAGSPSAAPEVLIFFHIPKTGGTTMDSILSRCFPGPQLFDAQVGLGSSAMSMRPREKIEAKYRALPADERGAIRCVMGAHVPMGIHAMLDRPAKYFTILRPPVERVASHFFDDRRQRHLPCHDKIKDMSLDDYLRSGLGLTPYDSQVRMLSGCPELDAPWDPAGGPISPEPVTRRHLELAKRNIEERFVAAAPLDSFVDLLMLLRRRYGWKMHQILFVRHNVAAARAAKPEPISEFSRRTLEQANRHDLELHAWAKARFAEQMRPLEQELVAERRRFDALNRAVQTADRITPRGVRRAVGDLLRAGRAA